MYKEPIEKSVKDLMFAYSLYSRDVAEAKKMVTGIDQFGNYVAAFLLYAKAASHVSPRVDTAESESSMGIMGPSFYR